MSERVLERVSVVLALVVLAGCAKPATLADHVHAAAEQQKPLVVEFYADWCAPCRKIDAHVLTLMQKRSDIAVRKVNVVSWETPIAARLTGWKVGKLPHVVVYGKDGKQVKAITGFDLAALDKAIAAGGAR